jgi:NADH-quinone oxidoreductase subunit L
MNIESILPILLGLAWLLPLASFVLILFFGKRMGHRGKGAGYLATGAIGLSLLLSLSALLLWIGDYPPPGDELSHGHHAEAHAATDPSDTHQNEASATHATGPAAPAPISGEWYSLCEFGDLKISIGYYIDSLTLIMFSMVTLVASCIHLYSFSYMHDELHEFEDPLVKLADGKNLKRAGRFHRFYQYLSLFCFSMLGLVIASNIAMVFVFWELVGICSYFLIGFYIERKSACNAANKAFIVNRVGDFGFLVGLMIIFTTLGTFSFSEIFEQVRPAKNGYELTVPDGMVQASARSEIETIRLSAPTTEAAEATIAAKLPDWRSGGYGYGLLVVAGLGVFCGCVGKSAQFPLHVWLPDAMEGPTPVSALIHAATMVAAGVYLTGRFFPFFSHEVLLTIACTGAITLFIAATIAITATDIKRVLAYSTVSQLGYMMLSLGLGGWLAGLFHLITHAFFKSLLFLGSGSVIHASGTNEMPEMGGLRKIMPWTAYTMLVGCLAISGAGIPLLFGFSGYHSKDSILAQAYLFGQENGPLGNIFFWIAASGATITSFYMFRLWYMTFAGKPRDKQTAEHAHESPRTMVIPLVVLAVMATIAGWNIPWTGLGARPLIEQARPVGTQLTMVGNLATIPSEHLSHAHEVHLPVSFIAFFVAAIGFILATSMYGLKKLDPNQAKRMFAPLYWLFRNKWWFDELYAVIFIRPVHQIAACVAAFDRDGIDWFVDRLAAFTRSLARADDWIDRTFVDGLIDWIGNSTYRLGARLSSVQSGHLAQYIVTIGVGLVGLFLLATLFWSYATAG